MAMRVDAPPPSIEAMRDGGGSGWVSLIVAHDDIDAALLSGRLAEAGVESRLVKDRSGPGAWLYGGSDPWAPVTVMVRKYQLEDARIVLAEVAMAGPEAARVRGPNVGTSMKWWLVALGLGILLTGLALARTADAIESNTLRSCELPLLCGQHSER
jgi:hypothetical protein